MRIYLASRWGRREELKKYARMLEEVGCIVTSRWLIGHVSEAKDDGIQLLCEDAEKMQFALEDLEDIRNADLVISFTDGLGNGAAGRARGGRHVEFGYAYAKNIPVWVVGPKEHVFHWLPQIGHHDTFDDAFAALNEWIEKIKYYEETAA